MENKFYYEIHVTGKNDFNTCIISDSELDDNDIILKGYEEGKLEDNDCQYVDYINELSFDEWNDNFNFNN